MTDHRPEVRKVWVERQITAMRLDGITTDAAILRAYLHTAYEKGQADAQAAPPIEPVGVREALVTAHDACHEVVTNGEWSTDQTFWTISSEVYGMARDADECAHATLAATDTHAICQEHNRELVFCGTCLADKSRKLKDRIVALELRTLSSSQKTYRTMLAELMGWVDDYYAGTDSPVPTELRQRVYTVLSLPSPAESPRMRNALENAPTGKVGETHGDLLARYYAWYEVERKAALAASDKPVVEEVKEDGNEN